MWMAGFKFSLVLLVQIVLPNCSWAADCLWARGNAHCLHYDLNITSNKQPWCMAQGQVDEKNYLLYDCGSDKVIYVNFLRKEIKATKDWKEQISTLRDVGALTKQQLPDIKREKYAERVPFTMQVKMMCQCKANGSTSGSREFGLDGQRLLIFDSKSRKHTVDHSRGKQVKEKWENDKEITKFFTFISMGDCNKWLKHLVHWKKEPETTAAPTTAPAIAPSKATTITPVTSILFVSFTCWTVVDI